MSFKVYAGVVNVPANTLALQAFQFDGVAFALKGVIPSQIDESASTQTVEITIEHLDGFSTDPKNWQRLWGFFFVHGPYREPDDFLKQTEPVTAVSLEYAAAANLVAWSTSLRGRAKRAIKVVPVEVSTGPARIILGFGSLPLMAEFTVFCELWDLLAGAIAYAEPTAEEKALVA